MKKYAKFECGTLRVPQNYPCSIELDGQTIHNPTEEQFVAAGYLPLEESEHEEQEGKVAIASYDYNKKRTAVVQSWQYFDEPEECIEDGMPEEQPTPKNGKKK